MTIEKSKTAEIVQGFGRGMDEVFKEAMEGAKYTEITILCGADIPKLYRFHWDCGRHGSIDSVLLLTDAEIDSHVGQSVCFGEVLGKHSHIDGTFDREDLTLLTDNQAFIAQAKSYGLVPRGLNPIHAIDHPEEYE